MSPTVHEVACRCERTASPHVAPCGTRTIMLHALPVHSQEWVAQFQVASQASFFQFTPSEMANVIWAFAKLGAKLPAMWLDNFLMVAQVCCLPMVGLCMAWVNCLLCLGLWGRGDLSCWEHTGRKETTAMRCQCAL